MVEGQNLSVEYRFAEGKENLLAEIAAELVRLRLEVIVAEGTAATHAAKNATQIIPIVMATSNDPVQSGLINNLNRPGGNVTGLSLQTGELSGKRLQLLTEIAPGLARVALLLNPANPTSPLLREQNEAAAQLLRVQLNIVEVRSPQEIKSAFAAVTAGRADALVVMPDAMFYGQHQQIVGFAAASRMPALFRKRRSRRPAV